MLRGIIKCYFVCFRDGQPYMYPNTIVLTNICSQIGKKTTICLKTY